MKLGIKIFLAAFFVLVSALPVLASVSYVYDDLGRLFRVFDGQGQAATYHYDAVGNILKISRHTIEELQPVVAESPPLLGLPGSSLVLTLNGFFLAGAEIVPGGPGIQILDILSSSDERVVFQLQVSRDTLPGLVPLTLSTPAGAVTLFFNVVGITDVSPRIIARGQPTTVKITANTDLTGATAITDHPGVSVDQISISGSTLTATFTPELAAILRQFKISIVVSGLTLATNLKMSGAEIVPSTASAGSVVAARITGADVDFTGASVFTDSVDVTVSNVQVEPKQIFLTLAVAPSAMAGSVQLLIDTPTAGRHRDILNVVVDPLAVVSIFPTPGAPSAPREFVNIRMSEPLEPSTVSSASILVSSSGNPIAGALTLAPDGLTVDFVPDVPLPPATNISVALTTALRGRQGARLAQDELHSFTTASQELFVDPTTGNDATGDGTLLNPFATVGRALQVATTGTLVRIAAGVYPERVTVPSGVTILGGGPDQTVFDGTGFSGPIVTALPHSAVLNLKVLNGGTGIFSPGVPLAIGQVALIEQTGKGIEVDVDSTTIGDLVIMRSQVTNPTDNAIDVCCDLKGSMLLAGNTITLRGRLADGIETCCMLNGPVRIIGNTVSGSRTLLQGELGIHLCCTLNGPVTVMLNSISEVNFEGMLICCTHRGPINVSHNQVIRVRNLAMEICCTISDKVEISANITRESFEIFLCCTISGQVFASRNVVSEGMSLAAGMNVLVANNVVTTPAFVSGGIGLCCTLVGTSAMRENTVVGGNIFVCCTMTAGTAVELNTVSGGRFGGMTLSGDGLKSPFTVSGNTITQAVDNLFFSGLFMSLRGDPPTVYVLRNEISGNNGRGVETNTFTWSIFRENRITNNSGPGILIHGSRFQGDPIGPAAPDLGTVLDPGENVLTGNGTADPARFFDLQNESPNPISAVGNLWDHATANEIDRFDIFDDEEGAALGKTIGQVKFEPFLSP